MTLFRGQTEKAGHFLQPATMAIGHKVIVLLLRWLFVHPAKREVAHGHHCERVGSGVQTKSVPLRTAPEASGSLVERTSSKGRLLRRTDIAQASLLSDGGDDPQRGTTASSDFHR